MSSDSPSDFMRHLGPLAANFREALKRLEEERFAARLEARGTDLWRSEPEHQEVARNRLGWLTVLEPMQEQTGRLKSWAREVFDSGYGRAVLLGMGGSSLCPEVLRATFGTQPGGVELDVLDSTNPAAVAEIEAARYANKTLFIVSTKSGTTIETLSFFNYFRSKAEESEREALASLDPDARYGSASPPPFPGSDFVAITDPGTPLEKLARDLNFREVFLNPPDIGGRYSALSYFGLVPAALLGLKIEELLDRGQRMAMASDSHLPAAENPGLRLGAVLAGAAAGGRDKITLLLSPAIRTFGLWAEQLIAESTGKDGRGLIPVVDEHDGHPPIRGEDRVFVALRLAGDDNRGLDVLLDEIRAAHLPLVILGLKDRYDLGAEFFRWEYATAAASFLLGVDPFDEPNVTEAKDRTGRLLSQLGSEGGWGRPDPLLTVGGLDLYSSPAAVKLLERYAEGRPLTLEVALHAFLEGARAAAVKHPYLALLAYLQERPAVHDKLQALRKALRDGTGFAVTLGYGPRYLHSTGQLHKGGPRKGFFLQITADDPLDLPIPGQAFGFSELQAAQAEGDIQALSDKGLPVLRVHLGRDLAEGLNTLLETVEAAVSAKSRK